MVRHSPLAQTSEHDNQNAMRIQCAREKIRAANTKTISYTRLTVLLQAR
jgi:hypothetical protein